MKYLRTTILALLLVALGVCGARAATIELFDAAFIAQGAPVDTSQFDAATGLGTVKMTFTPGSSGQFFVGVFFDHEIAESDNTAFNETAAVRGTPMAGQSWEIDEPGSVNGDIFGNFTNHTLDNGIGTSIYGETTFPDDVSMAMGFDFSLATGEFATVTFMVSDQRSPSGFFLSHTDPDSHITIYFSGAIRIDSVGAVPEPGTGILIGSGLLGLMALIRKRQRQRT